MATIKSTEEKAKAYDEVREKIAIRFGSNVADEIFSEYEETDDERIRKALLEMVHDTTGDSLWIDYNVHKEDALAWLEKQGNLMKALQISNAEIGELIEKNYYLKEQLEKQGKNNMGISEATKQKLKDSLNKALEKETPESLNEFLDEQNTAWSEEDEDILNTIINHFKVDIECTDEDDVIRWLKSLRPQNTWKPSDEQMDALHYVTNFDYGGHKATLVSLYEQLKKLREE